LDRIEIDSEIVLPPTGGFAVHQPGPPPSLASWTFPFGQNRPREGSKRGLQTKQTKPVPCRRAGFFPFSLSVLEIKVRMIKITPLKPCPTRRPGSFWGVFQPKTLKKQSNPRGILRILIFILIFLIFTLDKLKLFDIL
jgi:hypothetical protein